MRSASDRAGCLIRLILFLCLIHSGALAMTIDIIVPGDVLQDYREFVAGNDVHTITQFTGKKTRRDVVELVLIQQALPIQPQTLLQFQTMQYHHMQIH